MTLPQLPRAAVDEHNLQGGRLLYTATQMREYAAAAVAAERERCVALCLALEEGHYPDGTPAVGVAWECAAAIRDAAPEVPR